MWEPEGCYVSLHFILRAPDCTQGPRDPWVCASGGGGAAFPGEGCSSQAWAGVEMKQGWLFERVHDGSSLCGRVLDYISSVTLKCDVLPIHWLLQIAGLCSSSVLKKRLLYCFGFAVIISVQNKIKSQACYSWRIKYIIIICIITMLYKIGFFLKKNFWQIISRQKESKLIRVASLSLEVAKDTGTFQASFWIPCGFPRLILLWPHVHLSFLTLVLMTSGTTQQRKATGLHRLPNQLPQLCKIQSD